ncbi:MAG: hypothetical protein ABJB01_06490 [Rudaea sp.]
MKRTFPFRHNILWLGSVQTLELGFADATRKDGSAAGKTAAVAYDRKEAAQDLAQQSPRLSHRARRENNDENDLISACSVRKSGLALTGSFSPHKRNACGLKIRKSDICSTFETVWENIRK